MRTHTPWEPQKLSGRYLLWPVKIKNGKNVAKFPKTRHFIPVIIIPSKVSVRFPLTPVLKLNFTVMGVPIYEFCFLRVLLHMGDAPKG